MTPGYIIFWADDSLSPKVKSVGADHVIKEFMTNCELGKRKSCNLPGMNGDLPVLHDKDNNDLFNFGILQGVDFVAASFVQSAADVALIRQILGVQGRNVTIISKIENQDASDGIMIARGDPRCKAISG